MGRGRAGTRERKAKTMTANAIESATAEERKSPFLKGAKEVAEYIRSDVSTVRRYWRQHRLPYTKIGRWMIVRISELDAALEKFTFPAYGAKKRGAK